MAEEQVKETVATDSQPVTKEEHKANIVKKVISCLTAVMKAAFSKGDENTVWYKKGLYYTAAIILGGAVYAFTYYGIEIIDWLTTFVTGLF
jgi:hypothetical protein